MDSVTEVALKFELDKILDIVRQLRSDGYVQGQDFDFAYTPEVRNFSYEVTSERHTVFHFYNAALGTIFALKYI